MTKAEHIIASDVYQPSLDRLAASGVRTSDANAEVNEAPDAFVTNTELHGRHTLLIKKGLAGGGGGELACGDSLLFMTAAGIRLEEAEDLRKCVPAF